MRTRIEFYLITGNPGVNQVIRKTSEIQLCEIDKFINNQLNRNNLFNFYQQPRGVYYHLKI